MGVAGEPELLQRKSLFYRDRNLFPTGINQDKSNLNPIENTLDRVSPLCSLIVEGDALPEAPLHPPFLKPCLIFPLRVHP